MLYLIIWIIDYIKNISAVRFVLVINAAEIIYTPRAVQNIPKCISFQGSKGLRISLIVFGVFGSCINKLILRLFDLNIYNILHIK